MWDASEGAIDVYKRPMYVKAFMDGKEEIESLQERITGRYAAETVVDAEGNIIVKANHMITPKPVSYTHLDVYKRQPERYP